jgi:hypothetical protein
MLKDVDFPADKQKIIQHVQQRSGNNADDKEILSTLQNIEINNIRMLPKLLGQQE